ncbi:uncharacterized protein EDB91DRAFT_750378 [Suillus paluster]|uniref:uncharacterized protein n=1 Tax=Suillus paluster TaxID=48578 RepID=UPI001B85FF1C|nr:uncharacterized protein EDB91DRAFT_750378 [Suillus paluster]KAG1730705.1 hypothetical protein EDB91DRAFT_750378 [Suillus paluster]
MVRQTKQTPEEKKESQKRKTVQKKKVTETGVWPCKIDGCNKQFAREADLKRHQRTTKLHSVPGFACPQCDATFTRTDALRRHQKSRHNGVIIEPTEVEKKKGSTENEPRASGSQSHSRSPSPSSENPPDIIAPPLGAIGGPQGPHSYYRQHTMPAGAYMTPPLGVIVEGQYPPSVGLPTSSARLHQATWPPGAWIPDGSQPPPPMATMGYPHPYYSYYRGIPHPPPPELMAHLQNGVQPHSPSPCDESSSISSPGLASMHSGGNHSASGRTGNFQGNESRSPVIDPSLDISPVSPNTNRKTVSLKVTHAAVDVALKSSERESPCAPDSIHSPLSHVDPRSVSHHSSSASNGEPSGLFYPSRSPPHTHSFERPPEMEHMLTEDGEPMLNPAELLTQESLASPPPSL